jgi:hypothetical protein
VLPDFPSTKREIGARILAAIEHSARRKAPVLAEIKTRLQHEGKVHSYDRIGAAPKTEGFEEVKIPVTVQISEVPDLVGKHMEAKIEAIAEERARLSMDMSHRRFKEVADEVGNAVHAQGAPLTEDLIFRMLERPDMEFGPDNQPLGIFYTTPELGKALEILQRNPSFGARYQELLQRKRDGWRDRESNRKLVD